MLVVSTALKQWGTWNKLRNMLQESLNLLYLLQFLVKLYGNEHQLIHYQILTK